MSLSQIQNKKEVNTNLKACSQSQRSKTSTPARKRPDTRHDVDANPTESSEDQDKPVGQSARTSKQNLLRSLEKVLNVHVDIIYLSSVDTVKN